MASDAVDSTHELLAGAATQQLLISAATIPHQVVMQGHHYYVHRGMSPREEVLQCIASLERQILALLATIGLGGGRSEYTDAVDGSSGSLSPLLSTPFRMVDLTPNGLPGPTPVASLTNPHAIRGVRSGQCQIGISK
jgi:hypothetical protein